MGWRVVTDWHGICDYFKQRYNVKFQNTCEAREFRWSEMDWLRVHISHNLGNAIVAESVLPDCSVWWWNVLSSVASITLPSWSWGPWQWSEPCYQKPGQAAPPGMTRVGTWPWIQRWRWQCRHTDVETVCSPGSTRPVGQTEKERLGGGLPQAVSCEANGSHLMAVWWLLTLMTREAVYTFFFFFFTLPLFPH